MADLETATETYANGRPERLTLINSHGTHTRMLRPVLYGERIWRSSRPPRERSPEPEPPAWVPESTGGLHSKIPSLVDSGDVVQAVGTTLAVRRRFLGPLRGLVWDRMPPDKPQPMLCNVLLSQMLRCAIRNPPFDFLVDPLSRFLRPFIALKIKGETSRSTTTAIRWSRTSSRPKPSRAALAL